MKWRLPTEGWLICGWLLVSVLPFAVSGFARVRFFFRAVRSPTHPTDSSWQTAPVLFLTLLAWLLSLAWLVATAVCLYGHMTFVFKLALYPLLAVYFAAGTREIAGLVRDWGRRRKSRRLNTGTDGAGPLVIRGRN